jgi:hypothetical protein
MKAFLLLLLVFSVAALSVPSLRAQRALSAAVPGGDVHFSPCKDQAVCESTTHPCQGYGKIYHPSSNGKDAFCDFGTVYGVCKRSVDARDNSDRELLCCDNEEAVKRNTELCDKLSSNHA